MHILKHFGILYKIAQENFSLLIYLMFLIYEII